MPRKAFPESLVTGAINSTQKRETYHRRRVTPYVLRRLRGEATCLGIVSQNSHKDRILCTEGGVHPAGCFSLHRYKRTSATLNRKQSIPSPELHNLKVASFYICWL